MPHFHGLHVSVTPRTGSAAATRSAARLSPPPKTKKPVHFRGCTRGHDADEASAAAEDFKRPRAVSPFTLATTTRVPDDDDDDDDHQMNHDSKTVPFGSQQHVESIYSLASPWMEDAVASREKGDGTYGRGGARALSFEQEEHGDQVRV